MSPSSKFPMNNMHVKTTVAINNGSYITAFHGTCFSLSIKGSLFSVSPEEKSLDHSLINIAHTSKLTEYSRQYLFTLCRTSYSFVGLSILNILTINWTSFGLLTPEEWINSKNFINMKTHSRSWKTVRVSRRIVTNQLDWSLAKLISRQVWS